MLMNAHLGDGIPTSYPDTVSGPFENSKPMLQFRRNLKTKRVLSPFPLSFL